MNTAIVLSGGVGSRLASQCPKQYIEVGGQPIISYCLDIFQNHKEIDSIVIVAAEEWQPFLKEWIDKKGVSKFASFAPAGKTRQHSIYNGLKVSKEFTPDNGIVIIHDAARPCVSDKIISDCLSAAAEFGGAMPVITVKDTVYFSKDGGKIDKLLDRSTLFAGQAPEAFRFGEYLAIHDSVSDDEIGATTGTSQIAYNHGMEVHLVEGSEKNFKITTVEDLNNFKNILS